MVVPLQSLDGLHGGAIAIPLAPSGIIAVDLGNKTCHLIQGSKISGGWKTHLSLLTSYKDSKPEE